MTDNLYLDSINRVLDYIHDHLSEDLSVARLAAVAAFSPFHFHRLFRAITGEPLIERVGRLRLARAAALLRADPRLPVGRAAEQVGFESAAGFSRAFKRAFGISPSRWDRVSPLQDSKISQHLAAFPRYTESALAEMSDNPALAVQIRAQPAQRLATIRVFDSYNGDGVSRAYERLLAWYRAHGGDPLAATLYGASQDDPEVTPLPLCRYDIGLTAPPHWQGQGEVYLATLPACHLAVIRVCGDIWAVDRVWQYLYRSWLPRSRFLPADLPAMEIYHRQPAELGWEQYDIDCAVPVVAT